MMDQGALNKLQELAHETLGELARTVCRQVFDAYVELINILVTRPRGPGAAMFSRP
jgi:hypothetical protein